jgi:hypothetical protein
MSAQGKTDGKLSGGKLMAAAFFATAGASEANAYPDFSAGRGLTYD